MAINNILFSFYPQYVKYNHGIALLSAICKSYAIDTALYLLDTPEKFREHLEANNYGCVGFSAVTGHDYRLSLPFMQIAKDMGLLTLLGGVYPRRGTSFYTPVDYVCRGDAEKVLPYFLKTGNPYIFDVPEIYKDLNVLPLPDYDLFEGNFYNRKFPGFIGKKLFPYHSSRGCPMRCGFCESSFQTPEIRIRTKVEEDLTYLKEKYQPEIFVIQDELLPYYSKEWRESWGDFRHPFLAYIRADIAPTHLEWLYDRGLKGCFFGVESGDENHRNNGLGKRLLDKDIYQTVDMLKKMNIEYMTAWMQGTPGETWEMMAASARMADELGGNKTFSNYEDLRFQ